MTEPVIVERSKPGDEGYVDEEHYLRGMREARGWLGRFIGDPANKPGNIAGLLLLTLLLCTIALTALHFAGPIDTCPSELIFALISILTLTLGYLFGQANAGSVYPPKSTVD